MKKKILIFLMCLCIIGAILLTCEIVWNGKSRGEHSNDLEDLRDELKNYQTTEETDEPAKEDPLDTEAVESVIAETEETMSGKNETEQPETEPGKEEATLDFQAMWELNPEICAWIEIKGTKVDYPVLQSPTDDNKYLTTAVDGHYYVGGSLFTQATYNNKDFNDPVTIIYGHTMRSGTLFGQLQEIYTSSSTFSEHSEIILYLPDEVRRYTVFAAVPYAPIHILHTYDFTNRYWYGNFFEGVSEIRGFNVQLDRTITPAPDDRVLILSTCLNEDSTKRFLVMAIHQDDINRE